MNNGMRWFVGGCFLVTYIAGQIGSYQWGHRHATEQVTRQVIEKLNSVNSRSRDNRYRIECLEGRMSRHQSNWSDALIRVEELEKNAK